MAVPPKTKNGRWLFFAAILLGNTLNHFHARPAEVFALILVCFGVTAQIHGYFRELPWTDPGWRRRLKRDISLFLAFVVSEAISILMLRKNPEMMGFNFAALAAAFAVRAYQLNKGDSWPRRMEGPGTTDSA